MNTSFQRKPLLTHFSWEPLGDQNVSDFYSRGMICYWQKIPEGKTEKVTFLEATKKLGEPYPEFEQEKPSKSDFQENIAPNRGSDEQTLSIIERHSANEKKLFEHYGIPMDTEYCWRMLATLLAARHVEGFAPIKYAKPHHREKKWDNQLLLLLYGYVRLRQGENSSLGVSRIIELISPDHLKVFPVARGSERGRIDMILRSRYYEAQKNTLICKREAQLREKFGDNWVSQLFTGKLQYARNNQRRILNNGFFNIVKSPNID